MPRNSKAVTMYRGVSIWENPLSDTNQIFLPSPYGSYVGTIASLKHVIDEYCKREGLDKQGKPRKS